MFLGGTKIAGAAWWYTWEEIFLAIGNMLIFMGSQVLRIAGLLFNCVMNYTINFSTLVTNTAVVGIGWDIFRNLSNMVFIFILLTISIATILGIQSYGAKNLLKNVIIVALLINFSLFTTKVVIDSANVFTVGFYNATIANSGGAAAGAVGGADYNTGITAIFAGALNLNTIFKSKDISPTSKDNFGADINGMSILLVGVLAFILLIVTAFIFFAGSVLLMKRIIVLMFLMILSPLAFLGMILPATSGYSKQWWNTLFKESFYAPLFMMFIYVVAKAISSKTFKDNISNASSLKGSGFSNLATGGDTMLILFNFILIIGLLLASIITASKIGASGAGGMMSMGKNLNKWGQGKVKAGAGGAVFGVGGRLARKVIGGTAQKVSESNFMQNWAAKGGGGSRLALKTLRTVGDSSFDARKIGGMGKKMGIGEGIKDGYKTKRENAKKSELGYIKSLKLKGDSTTQATDTTTGALLTDTKGAKIYETKAEVYGKAKSKKTIRGTIWSAVRGAGTGVGQRQAGEALAEGQSLKRELGTARTDLLEVNKKLRQAKSDLQKGKDSGLTGVLLKLQEDDVENETINVEKIKEAIREKQEKIKEAAEKAKS